MKWTAVGKLPGAISNLAWVGDDLYAAMTAKTGAEEKSGLWRITRQPMGK